MEVIMDDGKEIRKLMQDVQSEYLKSNKVKDRIIILLIVLMFLEAAVFFGGFVWYESQFEYVETVTEEVTTTETDDADLSTEGDNASIDYNNVEGNQYNDSATHNEGGES